MKRYARSLRVAYERVKVLLELEHDLRKNDQRRAEAAEELMKGLQRELELLERSEARLTRQRNEAEARVKELEKSC